ncbi:hypothetical protein N5T96_02600 [Aliarcobacter butzleri]|uniref:hypothetical protein n=1 Tax=Aliarcobacter butzleri TaxID=28197 RepID=UPI0021B324E3|nr:hypothetical protein [Aliarcobacter butzleri]MCT7565223.1 hypothetical protein [Aliarcobacter butzleri]MCT7570771.1 hypothetical protein [Aliarcobacter butzleri]MCT7631675.1 hypothetical protein [Aliarcobacter butzleri]
MKLEQLVEKSKIMMIKIYLFKVILVICLILAYFLKPEWLDIVILITLVSIVLFPMNFYGAFIENLVEYNAQKLEDRVVLNAKEINKYFEENDKFKEIVKFKLDIRD